MKVSELTGAQLDYWVAKAEGLDVFMGYTPSIDWLYGGPIIKREIITLDYDTRDYGGWFASVSGHLFGQTGETPLIAAMRAYVMQAFGDEVEQE